MVDLTRPAVAQRVKDLSPCAPFVIADMEKVENWTLDRYPNIEQELIELGNSLPDTLPRALQFEGKEEFISDLVEVDAYCSTSRALELIRWAEGAFTECNFLDEVNRLYKDGGPEKIDRVAFRVLMDRLRHLNKMTVLQVVFAPERMKAILEAVRQMETQAD